MRPALHFWKKSWHPPSLISRSIFKPLRKSVVTTAWQRRQTHVCWSETRDRARASDFATSARQRAHLTLSAVAAKGHICSICRDCWRRGLTHRHRRLCLNRRSQCLPAATEIVRETVGRYRAGKRQGQSSGACLVRAFAMRAGCMWLYVGSFFGCVRSGCGPLVGMYVWAGFVL